MLYLRHGKKMYQNGRSADFPLDPGLVKESYRSSVFRLRYLLQKFNLPNKIIASPYLRTRETAKILQSIVLKDYKVYVPIVYDPLIGEYLGNCTNYDIKLSIRPETLVHGPLVEQNWTEFVDRVQRHIDTNPTDGWYITHGIFIKTLAFLKGKKVKYPQELQGIYILNNIITEVY